MKSIKAVSYFSLAAFVSVPEDSFIQSLRASSTACRSSFSICCWSFRCCGRPLSIGVPQKMQAIITEMLGNVNEEYATPNRPTWLNPTCLKKSCLRRLRVSAGTDTSENQANIYVGSAVAVVWLRFDLMFFWSLL
jgi:hypothetical protein